MRGVDVQCPRCRFTFTMQGRAAAPMACPQCRAPLGPGAPRAPAAFSRAPGPAAPPRGPAAASLSGAGELLGRAWEAYKQRWPTLLGTYLVAGLLVLVPLSIGALGAGAAAAFGGVAAGIVLSVAAGLAALWVGSLGAAAFVHAVADDGLSLGAAFGAARPRAWSFAWIFLLTGFLVTGGTLLLLVPGLVFGLWFSFAAFAALEDERGMGALLRSRALMRGHGLAVLGRLLLVSVIGALLGAIPLLGIVLSFLYAPFSALYVFALFEELRGLEPAGGATPAPGDRLRIVGAAVAGYLFIPALLVALTRGSLANLLLLAQLGGLAPGDLALGGVAPGNLAFGGGEPDAQASGAVADAGPRGGFPEFKALHGTWEGEPVGGGGAWAFTFSGANDVDVRVPGGETIVGAAVQRWDLGEEDGSLRVLPGGSLLDVLVRRASRPDLAGKTSLGSYTLQLGVLRLCLGEPGSRRRSSDFATSGGITCFQLERTSGPDAAVEQGAPEPAPAAAVEAPRIETGAAVEGPGAATGAAEDPLEDLHLFVYSVNYRGVVRVNGEEAERLEGKPDVQYNHNQGGSAFRRGENVIEIEYEPTGEGELSPSIDVRVSRWRADGKEVLGTLEITGPAGRKTLRLQL